MSENIKAVLFDLVGTLIYVKDPVGYVYSNVARSFGFETDYRKLDEAFSIVCSELSRQFTMGGKIEEKKWWRNVMLKTFTSAGYDLRNKFDDIFEELFKTFSLKSAWAVYPDVISVLEKLSATESQHAVTLRIGLISNFDSRLEIVLKELDLHKYFHCLAYSGKVGFSKPDPRVFQYALNKLNILPEEALYVGDGLDIDYYPACDLGINSLLIDRDNICKNNNVKIVSTLNQVFNFI